MSTSDPDIEAIAEILHENSGANLDESSYQGVVNVETFDNGRSGYIDVDRVVTPSAFTEVLEEEHAVVSKMKEDCGTEPGVVRLFFDTVTVGVNR